MSSRTNAITTELIRNELTAVAEEMGITMVRTARSITARETGDFTSALLDAEGGLMAQGFASGIHLGALVQIMPPLLSRFAGDIRPGDVFITNDPYVGLSHLPDIVAIMPVHHGETLVAFTAMELHHTDIGGRFAGGMGLLSSEIYEEGVRIPPIKYVEGGRPNDAVRAMLAANVRSPESVIGDLDAQVASCRRGADSLAEVYQRHGVDLVQQATAELDRLSESAMRTAIAAIEDGTYRSVAVLEAGRGDGLDAIEVPIALHVAGDGLVVDFEGTSPQARSAVNLPVGVTKAAAYIALRCLLDDDVMANSGLLRPIEVRAPEGSAVNPTFPAAVGARGMLLYRVLDGIFAALAEADGERVFATGDGGTNGMVFKAADGRILVDWYSSSWGARPDSDGIDGVANIIAGGTLRSMPAEVLEREFPIVVEAFEYIPDSGGTGTFRGGAGLRRSWRFLDAGRVNVRSCRSESRSPGLQGGGSGSANRVSLLRDGKTIDLPGMFVEVDVRPGDVLTHEQPGGGGFGPPAGRARERIESDLLSGLVTADHVDREYGAATA